MFFILFFADEERLFGIVEDGEIDESITERKDYQLWEDFAGVATNLLEKIEQYLESIDAIHENTWQYPYCWRLNTTYYFAEQFMFNRYIKLKQQKNNINALK